MQHQNHDVSLMYTIDVFQLYCFIHQLNCSQSWLALAFNTFKTLYYHYHLFVSQ